LKVNVTLTGQQATDLGLNDWNHYGWCLYVYFHTVDRLNSW